MKRIALLLLLVLCLVLGACGQEGNVPVTQAPGEGAPAASTDVQISSVETEATEALPEEFVEPTTAVEETTPDGGQVAFYLDAYGRAMYSVQDYPGGQHHEFTYYPSGGTRIWVNMAPDGSSYEQHYMDNGYVKDGMWYEGLITYTKITNPDGIVIELISEYDENGNRFTKGISSDGAYTENHYEIRDGIETVTKNVQKQPDGSYFEYYYENGEMTKAVYGVSGTGEGDSRTEEFYENGIKTKISSRNKDSEWTEEYDAEGKVRYYGSVAPDGSTYEIFYDNGNKTYEIGKNADGTFVEWRYEGMFNTEYIEGRFNEAGVRVSETVNDMKNKVYRDYKRNDAGIVTFYAWTSNTDGSKLYYFDDAGTLIKYQDGFDTVMDPAKLAEIAAELDLENS